MRLRNDAHADGAADNDVFMNFASGGHNEHGDSNVLPTEQHASTYEDPLDDVFGSAPASPVLNPSSQDDGGAATERREVTDPSDIPRLRSVHVTNGYREGLSASKEQYVQAGFDEGYSLGAELGMKVGWLLGVLEGVVRAIPSGSSGEGGRGTMGRSEVRGMLAEAEEEMSMKRLFGGEYFGGDGVWIYPVPAAEREGEEDVTFKKIADAHPVVVKWEGKVRRLAEGAGLRVG